MIRLRLSMAAAALAAFAATAHADEPLAPLAGQVDVGPLRALAVQDGGRRKPLDTFAREKVKLITGRGKFQGQDPVYTVLSMLLEPGRWEAQPAIKVANPKVIALLGKSGDAALVSLAELNASEGFRKALEAIDPDEKNTGPFENALLELHHRRMHFYQLGKLLRPVPLAGARPGAQWTSLLDAEGLREPLGALREGWAKADGAAASAGIAKLAAKISEAQVAAGQGPASPEGWKLSLELALNRAQPLQWAYAVQIVAALLLGAFISTQRRGVYAAGVVSLWIGVALVSFALGARTLITERAPVGNLYEAASFTVIMAVIGGAIFEAAYRNGIFGTAGAVSCALGSALIDLAGMDSAIQPLVPVLRSYWLNIHVTAMLVSYGVFTIGFTLTIYYLARWFKAKGLPQLTVGLPILIAASGVAILFWRAHTHVMPKLQDYLVALVLAPAAAMAVAWGIVALRKDQKVAFEADLELKTIERYMHRTSMVGFAVITTGIILGAVWANESWGRYWGWDPKETWAFITWIIYAVYVHGRIAGWFRGIQGAILTTIGYNSVLFTFFGVSFVLPGLHSYLKS